MSAQESGAQESKVRETNAQTGGAQESGMQQGNMQESDAQQAGAQESGAQQGAAAKDKRRTLSGSVVSDKMDKTVTVLVRRRFPHPMYGKYITRSSRLKAHDENNEGRVGDIVTVASCRPLSKFKSWRLVEVVKRAPQGEVS